jgi:hypothetical protein
VENGSVDQNTRNDDLFLHHGSHIIIDDKTLHDHIGLPDFPIIIVDDSIKSLHDHGGVP